MRTKPGHQELHDAIDAAIRRSIPDGPKRGEIIDIIGVVFQAAAALAIDSRRSSLDIGDDSFTEEGFATWARLCYQQTEEKRPEIRMPDSGSLN